MFKQKFSFSVCSELALYALILSVFLMFASNAIASQLVFRGQNTALFPDANPNSTAAMLNSVEKPAAKSKPATPIDQNRLIIQGLQSQITNKIYNDIFNTSNASGNYSLPGGGSISFVRSGGNVTITIVDATGTTSQITVPDI